jgi:hypothetical protein
MDPWMWLFQNVGRGNLPIINYSGGTEISGAAFSQCGLVFALMTLELGLVLPLKARTR